MHLNIKSDKVHALASELSTLTGKSLTASVEAALEEKLARERRKVDRDDVAKRILAIAERYRKTAGNLPTSKELEEGFYDEHGLPK